jgi:hypothetical protein
MAHSTSISISNRSGEDTRLWVEPWGDEVELPAGSTLRVVAESVRTGEFEVEYGGLAGITLWAWSGSTLRCYISGEEMKPGAFSAPFPEAPPGMTAASFLRKVLGRDE